METGDITLLFKVGLDLLPNTGIVMDCKEQSIAILKREDKRGIYYSINDTINGVPQKPYHDSCLMTLILLNAERFKYPQYNSKVTRFV